MLNSYQDGEGSVSKMGGALPEDLVEDGAVCLGKVQELSRVRRQGGRLWRQWAALTHPLLRQALLLQISYLKNIFFCVSYKNTWCASIPVFSVPDPDPPDPHVFGPPGSGSISQRYGSGSGSGSGSFYHHAKIVRKPLIPTIL